MSIGLVRIDDEDFDDLHVDLNDDECVYIKQDDDWVAFPKRRVTELIAILDSVARRL